jgi:hypothetical protein
MAMHLPLKEHYKPNMKRAIAAQVRLQTLAIMYGVVAQSKRAVQVPCVQAVALYGSEPWVNPTVISR